MSWTPVRTVDDAEGWSGFETIDAILRGEEEVGVDAEAEELADIEVGGSQRTFETGVSSSKGAMGERAVGIIA